MIQESVDLPPHGEPGGSIYARAIIWYQRIASRGPRRETHTRRAKECAADAKASSGNDRVWRDRRKDHAGTTPGHSTQESPLLTRTRGLWSMEAWEGMEKLAHSTPDSLAHHIAHATANGGVRTRPQLGARAVLPHAAIAPKRGVHGVHRREWPLRESGGGHAWLALRSSRVRPGRLSKKYHWKNLGSLEKREALRATFLGGPPPSHRAPASPAGKERRTELGSHYWIPTPPLPLISAGVVREQPGVARGVSPKNPEGHRWPGQIGLGTPRYKWGTRTQFGADPRHQRDNSLGFTTTPGRARA